MTWQTMTFERKKLYDEIWTEPMTSVAKRYKISDVGLRKICVKLAVPVPPRGYWAKIEAGQKIDRTPLRASNVHPTFTRSINIEEVDEAFERRVLAARESSPVLALDEAHYQPLADSALQTKEVKQVASALKKNKPVDGVISWAGYGWADVSVSEGSVARALSLLDRFAWSVSAIGGTFIVGQAPAPSQNSRPIRGEKNDRSRFDFHGEEYYVRIKERIIKKEVVEPVPNEPSRPGRPRKERPSAWVYRSPKFEYIPTGNLVLSVQRVGSHYELQKTEDTKTSSIEAKLNALIFRLEEISLRRKVESEIRHEKRLEYQRLTGVWEIQKSRKDALLKQFSTFENMAKNADRADALRRLVKRANNQSETPPALLNSLELISLMADWLDPLIRKHWPDVDDVPEHNPHRSW